MTNLPDPDGHEFADDERAAVRDALAKIAGPKPGSEPPTAADFITSLGARRPRPRSWRYAPVGVAAAVVLLVGGSVALNSDGRSRPATVQPTSTSSSTAVEDTHPSEARPPALPASVTLATSTGQPQPFESAEIGASNGSVRTMDGRHFTVTVDENASVTVDFIRGSVFLYGGCNFSRAQVEYTESGFTIVGGGMDSTAMACGTDPVHAISTVFDGTVTWVANSDGVTLSSAGGSIDLVEEVPADLTMIDRIWMLESVTENGETIDVPVGMDALIQMNERGVLDVVDACGRGRGTVDLKDGLFRVADLTYEPASDGTACEGVGAVIADGLRSMVGEGEPPAYRVRGWTLTMTRGDRVATFGVLEPGR